MLLNWHIEMSQKADTAGPFLYTSEAEWINEVFTPEGMKQRPETFVFMIEPLMMSLIKQLGGKAGPVTRMRGDAGPFTYMPFTYIVYPGDLENWPDEWAILENNRKPCGTELVWREFCKEGLKFVP